MFFSPCRRFVADPTMVPRFALASVVIEDLSICRVDFVHWLTIHRTIGCRQHWQVRFRLSLLVLSGHINHGVLPFYPTTLLQTETMNSCGPVLVAIVYHTVHFFHFATISATLVYQLDRNSRPALNFQPAMIVLVPIELLICFATFAHRMVLVML